MNIINEEVLMKKILSVLSMSFLFVFGYNNAIAEEKSKLLTEAQPLDIVYGKDDALVTMIEYASLSCSHCANFHKNVFPKLEEKLIKTGKLKLIYRHYPLNPPALRAAQLVECVTSLEKKQKFIKALFRSQSDWAYKSSEKDFMDKIKVIAEIGGLDVSNFNKCTDDKDLEDKILAGQLKAGQELSVKSTPTIFINGKVFLKAKDADTVVAAVEEALKKLEKK